MSTYTLQCEYLVGNKVWGHARNTNRRVPQATAWLGTVTHSLRCTFWHRIEYLCWGTRKQRNNLHQTNSSTLYCSCSHFRTKVSLERCSVFTCSTQVCQNQCHHTTTFSMSKMQPHVQFWVSDSEGWAPFVQCISKIHGVLHMLSGVLLRFKNGYILRSRKFS